MEFLLNPPPYLFTSRDRDVTSGSPTGRLTTAGRLLCAAMPREVQNRCVMGFRNATVAICIKFKWADNKNIILFS